MPHIIRCPNCAAPITIDPEQPVLKCQYCGADIKQTVAHQPVQAADEARKAIAEQGRRTSRLVLWIIISVSVVPVVLGIGAVVLIGMCGRSVERAATSVTSHVEAVSRSIRESAARRSKVAPEAAEVADPEDPLRAKLVAYLRCANRLSSQLHTARARYFYAFVESDAGPTCQGRCLALGILKGPVAIAGLCSEVERAKAGPPSLPELERAGEELIAVATTITPLLDEAHRYYDQKDYREDDCARARELYAKLRPAFSRFEAVYARLREILGRDLPALEERQLSRVEKKAPKSVRCAALRTAVGVRRLMEKASVAERDPGRVPELRAAIAALAAAAEPLQEQCKKVTPASPYWLPCVDAGRPQELLKSAKELAWTLSHPNKKKRPPRYWEPGSPGHLRGEHGQALDSGHLVIGLLEPPRTEQGRCR